MALANLCLALLLVAAQYFLENGYGLLNEMAAVVAVCVLVAAFAVYALFSGAARVLHRGESSPTEAGVWSGVRVSAGVHGAILLLLGLLYLDSFRSGATDLSDALGPAAVWCVLLVGWVLLTALLRKLPRVAVERFGAAYLLAALAVVGVQSAISGSSFPQARAGGAEPAVDLANFYYIVLDGHAGFPGFPKQIAGAPALRDQIRRDYQERGFEVYQRAYSNYFWTDRSLYSLLDNELHDQPPRIADDRYQLPSNKFFREVLDRGYRPLIYHNDYLDVCSAASEYAPRCSVHRVNGFSYDIPGLPRDTLLMAGLLGRAGWSQALEQKRRFFGVANAIGAFDELIRDVATESKNRFVFAHLLIPHEPFVLDSGCRVREADVWDPTFVDYYSPPSPSEARRRWVLYLDQLACVHGRVLKLLEALEAAGIYEESTVIIHSDHGARIGLAGEFGPPRNERLVSRRTFLDFYAALFAVKRGAYPLQTLPDRTLTSWIPLADVLSGLMGWPRAEGVEFVYRGSAARRYVPPFLKGGE